jgi:adenosylmethionine-8-amino-7-oxononanoate aminotransferase
VLAPRLGELGLYCRLDDRGDPVVQLSPPLVAGDSELDEIAAMLRDALSGAWDHLRR